MVKDYKIHAGKNFIGRADNMHIQILGDNTISRINHAAIIYDSKNRSTYLLPGDSSGLAYLNGEAVYTPVALSAFSVIEIGQSKFILYHCVENILNGKTEKMPIPKKNRVGVDKRND